MSDPLGCIQCGAPSFDYLCTRCTASVPPPPSSTIRLVHRGEQPPIDRRQWLRNVVDFVRRFGGSP